MVKTKTQPLGILIILTVSIYSGCAVPVKYLAPECLKKRKYTTKSDVWAFGVTMWEMFSAEQPYKGIEVFILCRTGDPPTLLLPAPFVRSRCWAVQY